MYLFYNIRVQDWECGGVVVKRRPLICWAFVQRCAQAVVKIIITHKFQLPREQGGLERHIGLSVLQPVPCPSRFFMGTLYINIPVYRVLCYLV